MAGLNLRAEEVKIQVRVHGAHFGRVIAPTVMALGEDVDLIEPAGAQRVLEVLLTEALADAVDVFGGMEIEMHLSGRNMGGHGDCLLWEWACRLGL